MCCARFALTTPPQTAHSRGATHADNRIIPEPWSHGGVGIPTARPLTKTCLRNRSGFASVSDDLVPSLQRRSARAKRKDQTTRIPSIMAAPLTPIFPNPSDPRDTHGHPRGAGGIRFLVAVVKSAANARVNAVGPHQQVGLNFGSAPSQHPHTRPVAVLWGRGVRGCVGRQSKSRGSTRTTAWHGTPGASYRQFQHPTQSRSPGRPTQT